MPQTGGAIKRPPKPKPSPKPSSRAIAAKKGGGTYSAPPPPPVYSPKPSKRTISAKKGGGNYSAPATSKDAGGAAGGPSQRQLEARKGGNVRRAMKGGGTQQNTGDDKKTYLLRNETRSPATGKKLSASATISQKQYDTAKKQGTGMFAKTPAARKRTSTSGGGAAGSFSGGTRQRATPGGSAFNDPRGTPVRVSPIDRVGPPQQDPGKNPPPFFEGGGDTSGGAATAGANPLAGQVTSQELQKMDMEGILHGAKRRGRIKLTRGTE